MREEKKANQTEPGEKGGKGGEVEELREKIEQSGMAERTMKAGVKELDRYEKFPASSAESGVFRNYMDWLLVLPWKDATEDMLGLAHSEEYLNKTH